MSGTRDAVRNTRAERRRRRRGIALFIGLLASSTVVWQASHATFSATTSNGSNTLGAGTVTITDDHVASVLFTAPALAPGDSGSACIGVEYTGSLTPTAIKLYFTGALESNAGGGYVAWANDATSEADDNLSLQIQVNDTDLAADPGFNNCNPASMGSYVNVAGVAPGSNLGALINSNTNYSNGLLSQWGTIAANKWRVFKFTYTFSASAPNGAQNDGVKFNIVWEAQR